MSIRVSLESDEDDVLITVADEGKGIPPEHLPNIFRPFFTTKGHGTGLGLSLARRMVEAHGGHIEVTSVVGKGTEFQVRSDCTSPGGSVLEDISERHIIGPRIALDVAMSLGQR